MEDINRAIMAMNPHWEGDFAYDYPLKRKIFTSLMREMKHNLIVSLCGPRRTGKTVLMKQAIDSLIQSGFPRQNILFFSFDEESASPLELIGEWKRLIGRNPRGKGYFLFLDEIQNIEGWAAKLKTLYDNLNLKLLVSGSAAMPLRKGGESLAGRLAELGLGALSYKEYLSFSGMPMPEVPALAEEDYLLFMQRQLPELAINKSLFPKDYISGIVKKTIYEDARKYYKVEESEVMDGMFKVICRDPGQIISTTDIAKDFGISRPTAASYLEALEKSFLARKLYNFSRNARKIEVRARKYYPGYSTLAAYTSDAPASKLAETETASRLNAEFFYHEKGREIDFLCGKKHDAGIEVKMRRRVQRSDLKWLFDSPVKLARRIAVVPVDAKIEAKDVELIRLFELDKLAESL